jgi:hypothetical protein
METVDATQPTVAIEPVGASHSAVAADPAGGTQQPPAGASQPVAPGGSAPGDEACAHCGAPLARDQRYCLECGTPRTYLSGMLLERLRAPAGQVPTGHAPLGQAQPGQSSQPPNGTAPYGTASSSAWPRNNVLTLIAGIGVLLLAMGVGVLIGRSGGSSSATTPAPQVTVLGAGTTGAASTGAATTPTTSTPEETASSTKKTGSSSSAEKTSKAKLAPGVGSVPSKPAPPSVLKSLHTKSSGGNYEQKSKNLPDVVED